MTSQERKRNFQQMLAEVVGTYCLIFAGTGAAIINDVSGGTVTHLGISLTFGLIVCAMIYSLGSISGCHMNPAVSIALFVDKKLEGRLLVPYILSQLIGACLASGTLKLMFPDHLTLGATLPSGSWLQSFVLEVCLTFLLMFVVLRLARESSELKPFCGIVIGGVIALEAMFAGPISGASMNPARSIAPAVMSGQLQSLWIYIVAPILGALIAVPIVLLVSDAENQTTT